MTDPVRDVVVRIANGTVRAADGRIRILPRIDLVHLARRLCKRLGWAFQRKPYAPLPPLTDEQRRVYEKLRPVLGREAALIEATKGDGE